MHLPRPISSLLLSFATIACANDPESTSPTSTDDSDTSTSTATTTTSSITSGDTISDGMSSGDATTGALPTTGDVSSGDTTTADPALHAVCEAALAGERAITEWLCACTPEGELGEECRAHDQAGDTCACDLLTGDPEHTASLACNAAAAALLDGCIADVGCGIDGVRSCLNPYWEQQSRCPALPRSAAVELQCRGAAVFVCGSGEQVPDTWKCDGFEDCPDHSDEAACGFVCGDGQVYPFEFQCDGEEDCRDGSDEQGCL